MAKAAKAPAVKPAPYLRNQPGTKAQPADPVTGQLLQPDTLRLAVSHERVDYPAQPDIDQPADTTSRPLRLHTPVVEQGNGYGDGLGGHCFSRDFARYLASVLPTGVARREFILTHWWANLNWARRVVTQFVTRFGEADGQMRYQVALAVKSGWRDLETLSEETGRSLYWLQAQVNTAEAFAFHALARPVRVMRPIEAWRDQSKLPRKRVSQANQVNQANQVKQLNASA